MAKKFDLTIVTPDGKKITDEVEILNCFTSGGAVGILAGHLPMVAVLEINKLNYKKDGQSYDFAISGGILNVKENEVIVLAETFESADDIDLDRATKAKERAEERLNNPKEDTDIARAELALKRAINRLSLK